MNVSSSNINIKKSTCFFISLMCSFFLFGQTKKKELDNWIKEKKLVFNSPSMPLEFEHFIDCDEMHAFRKNIGDTIILYSRGGQIAESLSTLKKSILKSDFNKYRYPTLNQNNGTVLIQHLRKRTFIVKRDSIFLLDEHNDVKIKEHIKIMNDFYKKKISKKSYIEKLKKLKEMDFGFIPKFKLIYFKGMFDDSKKYVFDESQNFRKEEVFLVRTWEENNQKFFEIELKTNTAGNFIFSEDFSFLNTERCNKN